MSLRENLSRFLRSYMEKKQISTAKLQAMLGISRNSLYGYLNGTGNPTAYTIEYIAEKLEVTPMAVIMGIYDPDGGEPSSLFLAAIQGISELPREEQYQFILLMLQEVIERWNRA